MGLSYLIKANYDEAFTSRVYAAKGVTLAELKPARAHPETPEQRVEYTSPQVFVRIAKTLGIMDDFKAGVPRTAYQGIVTLKLDGVTLFVAPARPWSGYKEA